MPKHSHKNQIDIVTETQQNARWFMGYRKYSTWMDMTPAEWSRHWRNLPVHRRMTHFSFILIGIPLIIETIISIRSNGYSVLTIGLGLITLLAWVWIILALRKSFKKDKDA